MLLQLELVRSLVSIYHNFTLIYIKLIHVLIGVLQKITYLRHIVMIYIILSSV